MSKRIEEIIAVLKEIKKNYSPEKDLKRLRINATKKVAKMFGVTERMIGDTYTRRLKLNVSEFDELIRKWLVYNDPEPLKQKLIERRLDESDREIISKFFENDNSEPDNKGSDSYKTEKLPAEEVKRLGYLLKTKKQVILYGPPGTGKTWLAKNFVEENAPKTYKIAKRDVLENVRFFWWTINPNRWDYTQLEEGKSEGMWYGKLKKAFEEISDGDIVFVYVGGKVGKIYAVGTYEEKDGKPHVKVQKTLDGPIWRSLKDDPVLGNSLPVKMGARGTLFPLNSDEGLRICKLSNLNLSELGLSLEESYEEVESKAFVTFHPSYAYEEFVEGLRPETDEENRITYKVEEGIFKRICRNAYNALLNHAGVEKEWKEGEDLPTLTEDELNKVKNSLTDAPKFYLIIDEINRGDISRIFGELITLLEADKRLFDENELTVILPYSKKKFGIPPNLYIIGTMNTADRSIALIDVALRRRFGFIELMPDYDVLRRWLIKEEDEARDVKELAIKVLQALNEKIRKLYNRDHQIGHSYFIKLKDFKSIDDAIKTLKQIWFHEVVPLLQEYFYDSPEKLSEILKDFVSVSDGSYEFRKIDDFTDEEFEDILRKIAGESSGQQ